MPVAAIVPVVILAIAYVVWVIRDISLSQVRYLPKWAWALITVVSIPLGGLIYLLVGKEPE